PAKDLLVCPEGQVAVSFHSRPLLPLALDDFRKRLRRPRATLNELLGLAQERGAYQLTRVAEGRDGAQLIVCINGNEAPDWRQEEALLDALSRRGCAVAVVDPRGVGPLRPRREVRGQAYED